MATPANGMPSLGGILKRNFAMYLPNMMLGAVTVALSARLLFEKQEYQQEHDKLKEEIDALTKERDTANTKFNHIRSTVQHEVSQSSWFRSPSVDRLRKSLTAEVQLSEVVKEDGQVAKAVVISTTPSTSSPGPASHKVTMI